MFDLLYANMLDTSILEIVAVLFGILSVWFARRENIWVYPTGIINVLIYVYICFNAGLYADMAINGFYFIMSVYGWYNWARQVDTTGHVPISSLSYRQLTVYILLAFLFFAIIFYILATFTNSTVPAFDASTTALFIVAMWLMALKKIENWHFWILGDFLVIPMFAFKGLVFTSLQYIVFLALAVAGLMEWKRKMAQQKAS